MGEIELLARLICWGYTCGEGIQELVDDGLAVGREPDPNQYAELTSAGYKRMSELCEEEVQ